MFFGKLLAAFGHPNGDPGRPKMAQKISKSGFVDISKTLRETWFLEVWQASGGIWEASKRHLNASGEDLEASGDI